MSLQATAWQTVGPYFRIGLERLATSDIAWPANAGKRIRVEGRLLDGRGREVPDAVIEIWQADASGQYWGCEGGQVLHGFGRFPTDPRGHFAFSTIKPGPVPGPAGRPQSPHLAVRIMMRGLLRDLTTRMYFPDEGLAEDPVLQLVPEFRQKTLICVPSPERDATFIWNIELQGERETVFFDC
jgi:protocatechuate 3,4-dioxygenase alpha subunit